MSAKSPKKPRSKAGQSGSGTPLTSETNRKARRKRAQEAKDNGESEAGPSGLNGADEADNTGPTRKPDEVANAFGDADFVAFLASEGEEKGIMEEVEEMKSYARVRDKEKGKEREYESAGRKRKADEIDYDDGYANKKERLDAKSRRAPWALDVDWENCNNVAEMYVQYCLCVEPSVDSDVFSQATPRGGRIREIHFTVSCRRRSSLSHCELDIRCGDEDICGCSRSSFW